MSKVVLPGCEAPVLTTPRLELRGHRRADLAACAAIWADPLVTRYIGGRLATGPEVWSKLLRHAGHWRLMGFGYWAVEDRATGEVIGELGFADMMRELLPSIDGLPELGWVLAPHAHGKGLATEGAQAAIAWGDQHFGSTRTVCIIDPANVASLRVAAKCGYREAERTTYKGEPTILFTREARGA